MSNFPQTLRIPHLISVNHTLQFPHNNLTLISVFLLNLIGFNLIDFNLNKSINNFP